MRDDDTYADRVVREAMLAASGGLDADKVAEVVAKVVDAVHKQAEALKQADYNPGDYERIARAMAHAMKSADGLYRLGGVTARRADPAPARLPPRRLRADGPGDGECHEIGRRALSAGGVRRGSAGQPT